MIVTDPSPPTRRIVVAFFVAPWVPSLVVAFGGPFVGGLEQMTLRVFIGLIYGLVLTYMMVLVLGLPLYALLRRRVRLTVLGYALIGVAVAALPVELLVVLVSAVRRNPMPMADFAGLMVRLMGLGALGGVTFWAVAAARLAPKPSKAA